MCGVAGILNLDDRPADAASVRAITRALAHRGPDGEGVYVDGRVGLGHRRLAILDLSESGEQPMPCADGRYVVTFNGEIYNFVELRRELEGLGHRFRSESDTEVIGNAYAQWGAECVLRFNGMWAFAVWDAAGQELFLSRDRFGIKPLFYLAEPLRFVFASELKAYLFLPGFTPRENAQAMRRALQDATAVERVDDTLLQGVTRLQAGHNMLVSATRTKVWRWWNTLDHVPVVPRRFSQQAEAFRELFFDACQLRLRSDVPIATCLSGGVDSTAILSTLAVLRNQVGIRNSHAERQTYDSQRAFVATFPATPQDEEHLARLAIAHTGAEPRYRRMESIAAVAELEQYAYDFENIGKSLMTPLWNLYRELRLDGVVVSLDGHGSDELFAGYPWHLEEALAHAHPVRAPLRTLNLTRTFPGRRRAARHALMGHTALFPAYRWLRTRLGSAPAALAAPAGLAGPAPAWAGPALGEGRDAHCSQDDLDAIEHLGAVNGALYRDFHWGSLPHILRNFDRCSMAHGVEIRMPFLDWRIVCFAFGLPAESKLGGGFTKRVVREGMKGVMPEALRVRKQKIGFSPPMADWFNAALGDWVWDQVHTDSFIASEVWDGPAIRDFVEPRHRTRTWTDRSADQVWPFLQAHLWRQTFLERPHTQPL